MKKFLIPLSILSLFILLIGTVFFMYNDIQKQNKRIEYLSDKVRISQNEIDSLQSNIMELESNPPVPQVKATETKQPKKAAETKTAARTEPKKEVKKPAQPTPEKKPEPTQPKVITNGYDGVHISHDPVYNGTTASFFLYEKSSEGFHYKGADVHGGLFIPYSEAGKYNLEFYGENGIDVTFDQQGNNKKVEMNQY